MIITDNFVVLNFPKTGSTFIRNVLKEIHHNPKYYERIIYRLKLKRRPYFNNYLVENIRDNSFRYKTKDEHGLYMQIPKEHKHKNIVTVKRNIFEIYISSFEYGDWKKTWANTEKALIYNNFPNLNFEQFVDILLNHQIYAENIKINSNINIGPITIQFILFYFNDPFKTLEKMDNSYLDKKKYLNELTKITFLDQSKLNRQLYDFLKKENYPKNKINFILNKPKENTSTPKNKKISDYFTDELVDCIRKKEQMIFDIF